MAFSQRTFLIRLYEEYLEEASFLYAQRCTLFYNPEILWTKIGAFEERLEAHIDGLVVGGGMALGVAAARSTEGDFGELFAAMCVFCRQDRREFALSALERFDPDDQEKATAIGDALKYELPDAWTPDLLTILEHGDQKLAPMLARAFGYRRVKCGPQLFSAMQRCAAAALPDLVWALGRVAYEPAAGALLDYLRSEDAPARVAAAIALARMGHPKALDHCLDQVPSAPWAILPLGMCGGPEALRSLLDLAPGGSGDCLIALGLLGDPSCAPLLLSCLEQPDSAEPAAAALECLTGAGLYEIVFVPEETEDGEPTHRSDGRPFGSSVTRISRDIQQWSKWWQAHAPGFVPGVRYRHGAPFSPARLIDMLSAADTPHLLRRFCAEELATRYSQDFAFETDAPVARQSALLSTAAAWAVSGGNRFAEGAWYRGGYRCA